MADRSIGITPGNIDPRLFQLAVLSTLVLIGVSVFSFPVGLEHLVWSLGVASVTQFLVHRFIFSLATPVSLRSSSISALSLLLLLRVDSPYFLGIAASLAVGSKAVFRWRGRHFWNPANFALAVMLVMFPQAWVSPGQWGSTMFFATVVGCAGIIVVTSAMRLDVTLAFLFSYALLLIGRAIWLGDPLYLPLRELQSGALVIFAFFMISDPKTTPVLPITRLLFAVMVATLAFVIRVSWYDATAPILALAALAWMVPLLDEMTFYRIQKPSNMILK